MDSTKILIMAAHVNTVALVRDALRYQYIRNSANVNELVNVLHDNAGDYLDAKIDRLISEQTYDIAERNLL